MIRAGIYGATGYTGYLLVRFLSNHPEAQIGFATSENSAGELLSSVFPCPYDLKLVAADDAPLQDVDVAFLCLPHAESMDMVRRVIDAGVKAIDLSADFRLHDAATYEQWYGVKHTAPALLGEAVYGLPELHREAIKTARLIGNPGCYPTSVILGLYPLAANDLLMDKTLIADSKSGVSGAGRGLKLSSHFVEVNENFSPYSIGHSHRHISEMEQELNDTRHGPYQMIFSPHLLPVSQGILSTMYVTLPEGHTLAQVVELYRSTYSGEPFVQVLPAGRLATLGHVAHTNRCAISISQVGKSNRFIVVATIDNLIKGASGQALQNMNLLFGLDEQTGLTVKDQVNMSTSRLVIKIGGNEMDDPQFLDGLVDAVKNLRDRQPVIVHGGGKEIARLQSVLGLKACFIEGLRVTDAPSLDVAEMVLSGLVNKRLVARLETAGVPAIGLSGVDLGLIRVERLIHPAGDLGWVGRIVEVRPQVLESLLSQGLVAVISPISLGVDGHTYNVNADHAALAVAQALKASQLIFVSNVPGVLIGEQVVPRLSADEAEGWIKTGKISGGMVPKVRSALDGVAAGIQEVRITNLAGLQAGTGTALLRA